MKGPSDQKSFKKSESGKIDIHKRTHRPEISKIKISKNLQKMSKKQHFAKCSEMIQNRSRSLQNP